MNIYLIVHIRAAGLFAQDVSVLGVRESVEAAVRDLRDHLRGEYEDFAVIHTGRDANGLAFWARHTEALPAASWFVSEDNTMWVSRREVITIKEMITDAPLVPEVL